MINQPFINKLIHAQEFLDDALDLVERRSEEYESVNQIYCQIVDMVIAERSKN